MPAVLKRFDESHATRGVHILLHPHPLLHYLLILRDRECSSTLSCLWPRTLNICNRYDAPSTSRWLLFFLFFSFFFASLSPPLRFKGWIRSIFTPSLNSVEIFLPIFFFFFFYVRVFLFNDLQIDSLPTCRVYYLSRNCEIVCANFFFFLIF